MKCFKCKVEMTKLDGMKYFCPYCLNTRKFASMSEFRRVERQSDKVEISLDDKYKKLYSRLPKFTCKKGCHDCCGIVPFSQYEADKVNTKSGLSIKSNCKFICKDGCSIYENRPFMCRLFGVVNDETLICKRGGMPEYMITKELAQDLTQQYIELQKLEKRGNND